MTDITADLSTGAPAALSGSDVRRTLAIGLVAGLGLMAVGIPMAIVPIEISRQGLGAGVVGALVALEPVATLATRKLAGDLSDRWGAKRGMMLGLLLCALAGLPFVGAATPMPTAASLALLAAGRILTGLGESFVFVTSGTWPIGLVGRSRAGTLLSWIGIALFGGIAAGTALGTAIEAATGFAAASAAIAVVPLVGLAIAVFVTPAPTARDRAPVGLGAILARIWPSGLGLLLSTVGYAVVTSFVVLLFASRGWRGGGYALVLLGGGYVAARLVAGHRVDTAEGPGRATLSLGIETVGLLLIGVAPSAPVAFIGAAVSGIGISLIYPLLALPAFRGVAPQNLGAAVGLYDACFDAAILLAAPAFGLLAAGIGLQAIFLVAAAAPLAAVLAAGAAYRATIP